MARSDPIAEASLPAMRARRRPGHRDGRDDPDDRDDDQQFDQREAVIPGPSHIRFVTLGCPL